MKSRFTKILAGLAALTAFALGGAALATAGGGGKAQPAKVVNAKVAKAKVAKAKVAKATPAKALQQRSAQPDTDTIQDENGKDDATETPGAPENETADAAETGSEVPGNDGPGGHADEPGNPNADTQQEGEH
jgi:hypothetical protein